MHIEEFKGEEEKETGVLATLQQSGVEAGTRKKTVVGVGARVLFYPTLLYNVLRNKIQSEFHWWDEVDEFLLLGAVPFPTDVPRLKQLGVSGVITMNEPYETLVPTSLYLAHGIENLVLPTRDYLFAPSFGDICRAVDFIEKNATGGKTTYVHCKAGRGRSTTIVLCYLMQHRQMTPMAAYEYVRVSRPRVLLARSQWQEQDQGRRMPNVLRVIWLEIGSSVGMGKPKMIFEGSQCPVIYLQTLLGWPPLPESADSELISGSESSWQFGNPFWNLIPCLEDYI